MDRNSKSGEKGTVDFFVCLDEVGLVGVVDSFEEW